MIQICDVSKTYSTRQGSRLVLDRIAMDVAPGHKLGILGRNGSGKSTLIRIISGIEHPSSGRVLRSMSVSWPLAFTGAFQGGLSGLDNLKFICRVYGVSAKEQLPFVEEFSELGAYMKEPIKNYSSGMRARLAFALSMAIEFDCFLIDEIIAVGDSRFQQKCHVELFEKRRDRAMVLVSHDPGYIRAHCTHAAVLIRGSLTQFDNVDAAYSFYQEHASEQ
jgi:capsular polysaccharide transport system ATP-binding protein